MKKFAMFMVVLSLGMFTLGCEPAKKVEKKEGDAAPAAVKVEEGKKDETKKDETKKDAAAPVDAAAPADEAAK